MESILSTDVQPAAADTAEIVEELPEWKVDATFQLRVNNVCSKLIRRGVRPTYQRVRANMGEPPARLLREAMQAWTNKVLPTLYAAPKVEWAERPKAISPKVAELFEEMWLQAVAAAQVHYELGEDASSRLTHRETIDMVCHELRRVNARIRCIETSALRIDNGFRKNSELTKALELDLRAVYQVLTIELERSKSLADSVAQILARLQAQSEQQSVELKGHLDACALARRERTRNARTRRLPKSLQRKKGSRNSGGVRK